MAVSGVRSSWEASAVNLRSCSKEHSSRPNASLNAAASPMGQVIPGGLLTSAFLSLIVVRVPFERWGHLGVAASVERGQ